MRDVALALLTTTPTPTPTQTGLDPNSVSPGVIGFLATFALVVVAILLFVSMARRIRRIRYREEQAQREQARRDDETRRDDTPPPPSP